MVTQWGFAGFAMNPGASGRSFRLPLLVHRSSTRVAIQIHHAIQLSGPVGYVLVGCSVAALAIILAKA